MSSELASDGPTTGLMSITQTELYAGGTHLRILESHPEFRLVELDNSDVIEGIDHAVSFKSITMTPSVYLSRLETRLLRLGGRIHRYKLDELSMAALESESLNHLIDNLTPTCVILCVGLGARSLVGLNDTSVFPVRGQVVRLQAPWVKTGWTRQVGSLAGGEGGERTYVIPRGNGDVILGGTREKNDW